MLRTNRLRIYVKAMNEMIDDKESERGTAMTIADDSYLVSRSKPGMVWS